MRSNPLQAVRYPAHLHPRLIPSLHTVTIHFSQFLQARYALSSLWAFTHPDPSSWIALPTAILESYLNLALLCCFLLFCFFQKSLSWPDNPWSVFLLWTAKFWVSSTFPGYPWHQILISCLLACPLGELICTISCDKDFTCILPPEAILYYVPFCRRGKQGLKEVK